MKKQRDVSFGKFLGVSLAVFVVAGAGNILVTNIFTKQDAGTIWYAEMVEADDIKYSWSKAEVYAMKMEVEAETTEKVLNEYKMWISSINVEVLKDEAISRAMEEVFQGVLKGKSWEFINAGKREGVNSIMTAAIACYESRGQNAKGEWIIGNSWNSHNLNNISGMNARSGTKWNGEKVDYGRGGRDNRYAKYPSVEESIRDLTNRLKLVYIDEGLMTLDEIGSKYAPTNDKWEGLYGMTNHGWSDRVQVYYDKIYNLALKYSEEA